MAEKKLTLKMAAFCAAYIGNGGVATEAYKASYGGERMSQAALKTQAHRVLHYDQVQARLNEIGAKAAEGVKFTLQAHLKELAGLRDLAKSDKNFAAAITAEVNRGKAAGFYVNRSVMTIKRLEDMSEEELAALLGEDADSSSDGPSARSPAAGRA